MARRKVLPRKKKSGDGPRQQEAILIQGHVKTRVAHSTELAEDYVEVVADLIDESGEARAIDIARRLGVTHVTVAKKIARLARDGLVSTRPYRSIFLTAAGQEMAARSRERHQIVMNFLIALGVNKDVALADSEGIEHHVSSETLAAFKRFTARRSLRDR